MFQFVRSVGILALSRECDGVPLQQIRLLRARADCIFEIGAGLPGIAALHFSYSGKEVSVRRGAIVVIKFDFGQLHVVNPIPLQDAITQSCPIRFVLLWSAWNRQLELVVAWRPCARVGFSPAEILHFRRGSVHRSRMNIFGRAVAGFDPGNERLGNRILRAAHPVFNLPILLRRPGNHNVHAVFQVEGIGRGKRRGRHERVRNQQHPDPNRDCHFAPNWRHYTQIVWHISRRADRSTCCDKSV